MDSVPPIFVESVCVLLNHKSRQASGKIDSMWGQVSLFTLQKIYTLRIFVDETEEKLYAVARAPVSNRMVPFDSVDLKFITNFHISTPKNLGVLDSFTSSGPPQKQDFLCAMTRKIANNHMDLVPPIFVESVSLLSNHKSLQASGKIDFMWGQASLFTLQKIYTLRVFVDETEEKLYAVARAPISNRMVPLHSVDLKFITNFHISTHNNLGVLSEKWKEITFNELQRLIHFIRPTTETRLPVRHDKGCCNKLNLEHSGQITRNLLSFPLPVDTVDLLIREQEFLPVAEEFFQNSGPLYSITIWCGNFALNQSTVDALIENFVPVDGGNFALYGNTRFTKEQLERLILKCEMSVKKVRLRIHPKCSTWSFDFDKYYSKRKAEKNRITSARNGALLKVRMRSCTDGHVVLQWGVISRK
uniref:F-box C protein n=1 Tax=Steinernema glaseri TaxID=37863 RepID=A0A1I7ZED3_9BILA